MNRNSDMIRNWLLKTDVPLTTISKKIGVSRQTLYKWIEGSPIREKNKKV